MSNLLININNTIFRFFWLILLLLLFSSCTASKNSQYKSDQSVTELPKKSEKNTLSEKYKRTKDYRITITLNEPYRTYQADIKRKLPDIFTLIENQFQQYGYQINIKKPSRGYLNISKKLEIAYLNTWKWKLMTELKIYITSDVASYYNPQKKMLNIYIQKVLKVQKPLSSEYQQIEDSEVDKYCKRFNKECNEFNTDLKRIINFVDSLVQKNGGQIV